MEKYFPKRAGVDMEKLVLTTEGRYSVTRPQEAQQILEVLRTYLGRNLRKHTVLDLTANNGGDTINFAMHFDKVIALEWDSENAKALRNNVEVYGLQNVEIHNTDSTKSFARYPADVVVIDPPWGGPDYKEKKVLDLSLGNVRVDEFVSQIANRRGWRPKLIVLKLPYNYHWDRLKPFKHRKYRIRNFWIAVIRVEAYGQANVSV